jgi:hypothetical protein
LTSERRTPSGAVMKPRICRHCVTYLRTRYSYQAVTLGVPTKCRYTGARNTRAESRPAAGRSRAIRRICVESIGTTSDKRNDGSECELPTVKAGPASPRPCCHRGREVRGVLRR